MTFIQIVFEFLCHSKKLSNFLPQKVYLYNCLYVKSVWYVSLREKERERERERERDRDREREGGGRERETQEEVK